MGNGKEQLNVEEERWNTNEKVEEHRKPIKTIWSSTTLGGRQHVPSDKSKQHEIYVLEKLLARSHTFPKGKWERTIERWRREVKNQREGWRASETNKNNMKQYNPWGSAKCAEWQIKTTRDICIGEVACKKPHISKTRDKRKMGNGKEQSNKSKEKWKTTFRSLASLQGGWVIKVLVCFLLHVHNMRARIWNPSYYLLRDHSHVGDVDVFVVGHHPFLFLAFAASCPLRFPLCWPVYLFTTLHSIGLHVAPTLSLNCQKNQKAVVTSRHRR